MYRQKQKSKEQEHTQIYVVHSMWPHSQTERNFLFLMQNYYKLHHSKTLYNIYITESSRSIQKIHKTGQAHITGALPPALLARLTGNGCSNFFLSSFELDSQILSHVINLFWFIVIQGTQWYTFEGYEIQNGNWKVRENMEAWWGLDHF